MTDIRSLAASLKANGIAASNSEALRLAQEISGTSSKIQSAFDTNKESWTMNTDSRKGDAYDKSQEMMLLMSGKSVIKPRDKVLRVNKGNTLANTNLSVPKMKGMVIDDSFNKQNSRDNLNRNSYVNTARKIVETQSSNSVNKVLSDSNVSSNGYININDLHKQMENKVSKTDDLVASISFSHSVDVSSSGVDGVDSDIDSSVSPESKSVSDLSMSDLANVSLKDAISDSDFTNSVESNSGVVDEIQVSEVCQNDFGDLSSATEEVTREIKSSPDTPKKDTSAEDKVDLADMFNFNK